MTNAEKYSAPEERVKAFYEYARRTGLTGDGKDLLKEGFRWLTLNAEYLAPCPFCFGNNAMLKQGVDNLWYVHCPSCLYESRHNSRPRLVINDHNAVSEAIRASIDRECKE